MAVFLGIGEAAEQLGVAQHVLRFWEGRFPQVRPVKTAGGRRHYRPDDVELLRGIRHPLHGRGYTVRGVQRVFKEQGVCFVRAIGRGEVDASAPAPSERERASTTAEDVETSPGEFAGLAALPDHLREALSAALHDAAATRRLAEFAAQAR